MQVKEFYNVDNDIDDDINKWLEENDKNIKIIDIKYQVAISRNNTIYVSSLIIYEKIK